MTEIAGTVTVTLDDSGKGWLDAYNGLEQEMFQYRDWNNEAQNKIASLTDRLTQRRKALETAHHAITTLHGLTASDGLGAYGEALSDGCDASGAWDCYRDETWTIDESKTLALIEAALAALSQTKAT